jgi:hypothetical protein
LTDKVAAPPADIHGEKQETANIITWQAPSRNMDGSTPVNLLGYNVYRISNSQPESELKPLNAEPVTASRYEDKRFKFGEPYMYFVRSVSLGTEARPVESLNSNQIEVLQNDVYKPAAPDLATPNAAFGRIALFWTANSEPDVVGYYLHRSTDPNLPLDKWPKLTPQIYTRTTFTDENVETGKTYYYYVVAVDSAGNISLPSKVVSDTHVRRVETLRQIHESLPFIHLCRANLGIRLVHARRGAQVGDLQTKRLQILDAVAQPGTGELGQLGQIHLHLDAAQLDCRVTHLGRLVQHAAPGPRRTPER